MIDKRQETVARLIGAFGTAELARFASKGEENVYSRNPLKDISKEDCLRSIREEIEILGDGLSNVAQVHPAWITAELENESPKVIGIILRWLPSSHVRYILDHLPKRIKMSLPNLVESFAVPTPILRMIKEAFEKKFKGFIKSVPETVKNINDIGSLRSEDLEALFKDVGIHELAMAFGTIDSTAMRVLLNRMPITVARALQQRMKDVADESEAVLKDAKYTILEVAMDQEDIDKLLLEVGLAAFSKALNDQSIYSSIRFKLMPVRAYVFKRYIDQYAGVGNLTKERQAIVLNRYQLLSRAKILDDSFLNDKPA